MSRNIGRDIEELKSIHEEIRYTDTYYQDHLIAEYFSRDEMEIARLKMQYAKEFILKRSFAMKRLLTNLETHL